MMIHLLQEHERSLSTKEDESFLLVWPYFVMLGPSRPFMLFDELCTGPYRAVLGVQDLRPFL